VDACLDDNIFRMGAALAYYTLFSLAPLLLISVAVAGLFFGEKAAQGGIVTQIRGLIGDDGARAVQSIMAAAHKPASGIFAGILGMGVLVLGATGAFSEMYTALNNIWRAPPAKLQGAWSMVRARLLGFGLVLVLGFLMLASLVVSAVLSGIAKYAGEIIPVPAFVLNIVELAFTTVVLGTLFATIFRVLPQTRIGWKDVWVGGLVTAVMFSSGKFLIGLYIGKSLPASSYGAAGSVIVLIAWIYYSALILYFGAEFTRVHATEYGAMVEAQEPVAPVPPPKARAHHA
jgi:membrane protein